MIGLRGVSFWYGDKLVLDRLDLNVPERGITALMGPSGIGKTTVLRLLAGLERPAAGEVVGISGEEVAILFQEDRLLPWRTVRQNLTDVLPPERQGEVDRWLSLAELEEEGENRPEFLSGGMRRRLALVRALAYAGGKRLLLLDEPFTGLDRPRRLRLMEAIRALELPVLMATHGEEEVALADQRLSLGAKE